MQELMPSIKNSTRWSLACSQCSVNGYYFYSVSKAFPKRLSSRSLHVHPELTQQQYGKLCYYHLATPPSHHPPLQFNSSRGSTWAAVEVRILPTSPPKPPLTPHLSIMPHGRPPYLRNPAEQWPHSTCRAHTCSLGQLACRPVCCHGMVPTPGHS